MESSGGSREEAETQLGKEICVQLRDNGRLTSGVGGYGEKDSNAGHIVMTNAMEFAYGFDAGMAAQPLRPGHRLSSAQRAVRRS